MSSWSRGAVQAFAFLLLEERGRRRTRRLYPGEDLEATGDE